MWKTKKERLGIPCKSVCWGISCKSVGWAMMSTLTTTLRRNGAMSLQKSVNHNDCTIHDDCTTYQTSFLVALFFVRRNASDHRIRPCCPFGIYFAWISWLWSHVYGTKGSGTNKHQQQEETWSVRCVCLWRGTSSQQNTLAIQSTSGW